MNSQDLQDWQNRRGDVIQDLIKLATALSLSYRYTEKEFTIELPNVESKTVWQPVKDRGINWSNVFGPDTGIHEDELPPIDKPLEEGETPDER